MKENLASLQLMLLACMTVMHHALFSKECDTIHVLYSNHLIVMIQCQLFSPLLFISVPRTIMTLNNNFIAGCYTLVVFSLQEERQIAQHPTSRAVTHWYVVVETKIVCPSHFEHRKIENSEIPICCNSCRGLKERVQNKQEKRQTRHHASATKVGIIPSPLTTTS